MLRLLQKNYFSLIGIVAHEIGHHFLGHTVDDLAISIAPSASGLAARNAVGLSTNDAKTQDWLARRRNDELDADYFSGFVLAKLGAREPDAIAWLSAIPDPGEGSTHPRNAARKEED